MNVKLSVLVRRIYWHTLSPTNHVLQWNKNTIY